MLITAKKAADILGIKLRSVNKLCREGRFESAQQDRLLHWNVELSEVEEYKTKRRTEQGRIPTEYTEILKASAAAGVYSRADILQICKAAKTGKRVDKVKSYYLFYEKRPLLTFILPLLGEKYSRKPEEIIFPVWQEEKKKIGPDAAAFKEAFFNTVADGLKALAAADAAAAVKEA